MTFGAQLNFSTTFTLSTISVLVFYNRVYCARYTGDSGSCLYFIAFEILYKYRQTIARSIGQSDICNIVVSREHPVFVGIA